MPAHQPWSSFATEKRWRQSFAKRPEVVPVGSQSVARSVGEIPRREIMRKTLKSVVITFISAAAITGASAGAGLATAAPTDELVVTAPVAPGADSVTVTFTNLRSPQVQLACGYSGMLASSPPPTAADPGTPVFAGSFDASTAPVESRPHGDLADGDYAVYFTCVGNVVGTFDLFGYSNFMATPATIPSHPPVTFTIDTTPEQDPGPDCFGSVCLP